MRAIKNSELIQMMKQRRVLIEPILNCQAQVPGNDVGVDLRLDVSFWEFSRTSEHSLNAAIKARPLTSHRLEFLRDSFFLQPGEFVLALSFEYIWLPNNVLALLNGKSSLARRGLVVHATANVIDPGWKGHIVFELANLGKMPIELFPLMRIARLIPFIEEYSMGNYRGEFSCQIKVEQPYVDYEALAIKDAMED
ncbi:MAG: dCTP deaminase [Candidatus Tectomicrobia bacterium]|nr:dCTP deaminase [Candidatus Tectomicrobia bacterium]